MFRIYWILIAKDNKTWLVWRLEKLQWNCRNWNYALYRFSTDKILRNLDIYNSFLFQMPAHPGPPPSHAPLPPPCAQTSHFKPMPAPLHMPRGIVSTELRASLSRLGSPSYIIASKYLSEYLLTHWQAEHSIQKCSKQSINRAELKMQVGSILNWLPIIAYIQTNRILKQHNYSN